MQQIARLERVAALVAVPLLAFGLTHLPGGADGRPLSVEQCRMLVGGVLAGPCCDGTSGTACNTNMACLSVRYACTGTATGIKKCNNNGVVCNTGACDNGAGGCANHQCPYNVLCDQIE